MHKMQATDRIITLETRSHFCRSGEMLVRAGNAGRGSDKTSKSVTLLEQAAKSSEKRGPVAMKCCLFQSRTVRGGNSQPGDLCPCVVFIDCVLNCDVRPVWKLLVWQVFFREPKQIVLHPDNDTCILLHAEVSLRKTLNI